MQFPASIVLLLSVTAPALVAATSKNFVSEIFGILSKESSRENLVMSPVSVEAGLSLLYMGAEGATATELGRALNVNRMDKTIVPQRYEDLFCNKKFPRTSKVQLNLANRVYVDKKYTLNRDFNRLAQHYFCSKAESVDFTRSAATARKINAWVELQTAKKIKNLFANDAFAQKTALVLVNAIYFRAKWWNHFHVSNTQSSLFTVSAIHNVHVPMMSQTNRFAIGEFKDLNARIIELPYLGTDLTMLIILPNKMDGLASLERKLRTKDLRSLSERLDEQYVALSLPRFKVEFEISLQRTLEKMGVRRLFTKKAELRSLTESEEDLFVEEAKHKAFIEVNESGTEAAAATSIKATVKSGFPRAVLFSVDHPFAFVIKDKDHVYFVGHIIEP